MTMNIGMIFPVNNFNFISKLPLCCSEGSYVCTIKKRIDYGNKGDY